MAPQFDHPLRDLLRTAGCLLLPPVRDLRPPRGEVGRKFAGRSPSSLTLLQIGERLLRHRGRPSGIAQQMRPIGGSARTAKQSDRPLDVPSRMRPFRHHRMIDRIVDVLDERGALMRLLSEGNRLVDLVNSLSDVVVGGERDRNGRRLAECKSHSPHQKLTSSHESSSHCRVQDAFNASVLGGILLRSRRKQRFEGKFAA